MGRHGSMFFGALLLAGTAFVVAPTRAEACSCFPVTIDSAWHNSTDTFSAAIIGGPKLVGGMNVYKARVLTVFDGCTQKGASVFIETPIDSATCGETLTVGEKYLLTANLSPLAPKPDTYTISLCGYNRLLSQLTADEMDFLESREVFCPDTGLSTCADGTQPVQCLIDPCTNATCGVPSTCEANYCGGCNAEFFDADGFLVCP